MSGSTSGEKPLSSLTVVSTTSGLRVLGFTPAGSPRAIEPAAFAAAPSEGVALSTATPLAGAFTGQPGTATTASRADHRHPLPVASDIGAAPTVHTHSINDVLNLQTNLDSKSSLNHTHTISAVNGLQTALDAKANLAHTHAIGDVSGLQTTLDAKLGLATRGAINGVAPLGSDQKVPLANLPALANGASNVNNYTIAGPVDFVWNATTSKYDPVPVPTDASKRIKSVLRNSATVVSFAEYNNANIVLTGNAPLTLAASEAGTLPDQGMAFMIKNRHTAINTITFGAGLVVDPYPLGTGSGGAVKIASKGSVTVHVYPGENNTIIAEVRGQIV